jgi:hypothetical protein
LSVLHEPEVGLEASARSRSSSGLAANSIDHLFIIFAKAKEAEYIALSLSLSIKEYTMTNNKIMNTCIETQKAQERPRGRILGRISKCLAVRRPKWATFRRRERIIYVLDATSYDHRESQIWEEYSFLQ